MKAKDYLLKRASLVNQWIDELLRPRPNDPGEIWAAMRYSILAGGKRLRPVLMLAVGETHDRPLETFRHAAVALECIHTYSLIHDDLPCMDNDELRRGQPTCHVKFGEALAVLAGDALHTYAFELLTQCPYLSAHPEKGFRVVKILAHRAGVEGMIGGQVLDIRYTAHPVSDSEVFAIHKRKTAALITAALEIGAVLADVPPEESKALTAFGQDLGIAFQIVDDILDVTQPSEKLGKTAGKDDIQEKPTLPRAIGLEKSRQQAHFFLQRARAQIQPYDTRGLLTGLADFIIQRDR